MTTDIHFLCARLIAAHWSKSCQQFLGACLHVIGPPSLLGLAPSSTAVLESYGTFFPAHCSWINHLPRATSLKRWSSMKIFHWSSILILLLLLPCSFPLCKIRTLRLPRTSVTTTQQGFMLFFPNQGCVFPLSPDSSLPLINLTVILQAISCNLSRNLHQIKRSKSQLPFWSSSYLEKIILHLLLPRICRSRS